MAPDLVVIGGVVADRTPAGLVPGGAAFYAARTALALGARVGVLTHQRSDLDVRAALPGAEVVTFGASTLTFTNTYRGDGRVQHLAGAAPVLSGEVLPDAWQAAQAVLLGPVYHEVPPEAAAWLPQALVGVAPQGWMRRAGADGRVHPAPWTPPADLLRRAAVISLSEDDLGRDRAAERALAHACRLLAVTRSARGCTLYRCGVPVEVPGFPAPDLDPTGAGDVFAAALVLRLAAGDTPVAAAVFANAAASFAVQAPGVTGLPTFAQVRARTAERNTGDAHEHR